MTPWQHGTALLLLLTALLSGLRIHAGAHLAETPLWLDIWLPQGRMHALHLLAAAGWLAWGAAGLLLWFRTRPSARRWTGMALITAATVCSGTAVFVSGRAGWLMLHGGLVWLFAAAVVLHVIRRCRRAGWRTATRTALIPAGRQRRAWAAAAAVALAGVALARTTPGWWQAGEARALAIPLDTVIDVDGQAGEPAWGLAPPVTVMTVLGGGKLQEIPVTVRALRQGDVLYFCFQWPDAHPDLDHLPLLKSPQGWHVQHHGAERHNELRYYEDKFAVLFSDRGRLAGDESILLGSRPLPQAPPQAARRGFHATQGLRLDLWQWKAVRTNPLDQLDDDHLAAAYPPVPGEIRYTGGYRPDPWLSGGYTENWLWFTPLTITPKRLPPDMNAAGLSAPGLHWYESAPYQPLNDHGQAQARLPSVLWKGPFEGDRGDVRAKGRWQQGVWTLETARALASESVYDTPLHNGLYFWVAVFDHSQILHSYHLRPLVLRIPAGDTP